MVPLRLWLEFGWEFIVFLAFCVEQFCCLCLNTCNFAVQGVKNPLPWRDLTLRKYQCHSTLANPACTPGRLKLITWDLAYLLGLITMQNRFRTWPNDDHQHYPTHNSIEINSACVCVQTCNFTWSCCGKVWTAFIHAFCALLNTHTHTHTQ